MENNLLVSDINTLKQLFDEPLYLIKEDVTSNNIEKDPIIAELPTDNTPIATKVFSFSGNNLKKLVFIVFASNNSISVHDKELYLKTLAALKLNENDVAFSISSIDYILAYDLLSQEFSGQKIICFAESANYGPELLQVKTVENAQLFLCPSLLELSEKQDLKLKWWNGLKSFVSE